jgi:hypothetical protein
MTQLPEVSAVVRANEIRVGHALDKSFRRMGHVVPKGLQQWGNNEGESCDQVLVQGRRYKESPLDPVSPIRQFDHPARGQELSPNRTSRDVPANSFCQTRESWVSVIEREIEGRSLIIEKFGF